VRRVLLLALLSFFSFVPQLYAACSGPIGGKEGQCAPDFSLPDRSGKRVSVSSFEGKVIFLNFWATWCPPCVEEMASLEEANKKLASDRFVMLAVSIDSEGFPVIDKFFKGKTPSFAVLLDREHKFSHKYGTFKVPETYIIDKTGRVRDRVEGVRQWDDPLFLHYIELLEKQ